MISGTSGPAFQVESDKAFLVLGHSERLEVGNFLAKTLDERHIFAELDVISLNRAAAYVGRASLREAMKHRTVITHSAAIMRVPRALQIIAINPPEEVSLGQLLKRANEVVKDALVPEEGAHKTGLGDLAKAGLELARSPVVTVTTALGISRGYSSTERLAEGAEDFPAGWAMVHSEHDTFGFSNLCDLDRAAQAGVTTVVLPGHYHNEVLFAPNRTLDLLTPAIFPGRPTV